MGDGNAHCCGHYYNRDEFVNVNTMRWNGSLLAATTATYMYIDDKVV